MKSAAIILFFSIVFSSSPSTSSGQMVRQLGPNYFVAGPPSEMVEYIAQVDRQRSQNWCWAACIEMVLQYHGLLVTQEQIVTRCFGELGDQPGGEREMFIALNGWAFNKWGRNSYIYHQSYFVSPNEIQNLLAFNLPLIVGLNNQNSSVGHAYVLTALYYSLDQWRNVIPLNVVLRDPWPDNQSRQVFSWNEFASRVNSVHKIWVSYN